MVRLLGAPVLAHHPLLLLNAEHEPKMWDDLKGQFINHLDQVNADLKAAGLPDLNSRAN